MGKVKDRVKSRKQESKNRKSRQQESRIDNGKCFKEHELVRKKRNGYEHRRDLCPLKDMTGRIARTEKTRKPKERNKKTSRQARTP
jgi:hypothetical protein